MKPIDKFELTYSERNILLYCDLTSKYCLYEDSYGLPQRIGTDQISTGSDPKAKICALSPMIVNTLGSWAD